MSASSHSRVEPRRPRHPVRRALGIWVWIIGFSVAALVATYVMFVEPPPPRTIVIASGSPNGAYYRYAQQYAHELQKEHFTVEVRETAGSVENLQLLGQQGSGVTVAIVQSGVASAGDLEHFHALGSLYHEPLWVFYRGAEHLDRLSQLAGKRIGVGPAGSGTDAIAIKLLAANGLTGPESSGGNPRAVLVQENVADSAQALQKGTLDAAFFVAAFETDYIQSLLSDQRVSLMSFEQHEAYHRRFRFLDEVTVPAGLGNLGKHSRPGHRSPGADGNAGRSQGFPPGAGSASARDRHPHSRQG